MIWGFKCVSLFNLPISITRNNEIKKTHLLCNGDEEINNHLGTTSKLNRYSVLLTNKDAAIGQRC